MIELLPDSTFFYMWALFLVALMVLNFAVFQPALKVIAARRSATVDKEAAAETLEQENIQLTSQIEAKLGEARHEGQEVIQGLRQEGEVAASEIITKARKAMESELTQARGDNDRRTKEAELQLKQHASQLGNELAEKVLGRSLN